MLTRQRILRREHINKEFNKVFDFPLTVAVAAMGYGKTTSAKSFLNETNTNYTWVSVESDESSPQYIWDSFTRQILKTRPEIGKQLRGLGFPADAPQRDKVLKIIEDFTYMSNSVLVIDDYHFAHAQEFDQLLEHIVKANIPGFHILILSRIMPDISIDELMLKGYCYLVKSHLFEVNKDEIKQFFKMYNHNISDDTANEIYKISEGWVSAIYLIMQRYTEIGMLEPGKSIERLIESSVMFRYTNRELMILKSLCLLDSFTTEQAVYVTNDKGTAKILYKISLENSFIRYEVHNDTYRIHNILNNYFKKLIDEQPEEVNLEEIYKRSGQWCINNGDIITGLRYLLKAKEYALILKEFEKSSINLVIDSNPTYIIEIFKQIPLEVKYTHPIGYLSYIGFYVTNVNPVEGKSILEEIEKYYINDTTLSLELKNRLSGEIELIRAYTEFNDAFLMHDRLEKAHKMLGGHSSIANKDKIITFGSPHSLYLYYREKGELLSAMECVVKMFPYYMEMAGGCGKGFDDLLKGEYYLETGVIEKAEIYAHKATYKAKTMNQTSVIICANFMLARICLSQGKYNEALEIMDDLNDEVEACNSPILNSAFDLCAGYIGGIINKEISFANWLKSGDIFRSEVLYQGMGFNYIAYAKYLLITKEYIKLEVLCEEMHNTFSQFNNMLGNLHTFLLEGTSLYKLYGLDKAKTPILNALDIGKADQIILPFAEYGVYIIDILVEIQNELKDDYLDKLINSINQYNDKIKINVSSDRSYPILTNREKEILERVVQGRTNKEISRELFIAEVTVRKNITSIYRKLDVVGRAQAVKRALELKMI